MEIDTPESLQSMRHYILEMVLDNFLDDAIVEGEDLFYQEKVKKIPSQTTYIHIPQNRSTYLEYLSKK